jgi:hypothetical protein
MDAKLIEILYKMNGNADLADKEGLKGVKCLKMLKELGMLNFEGLEQKIVPAGQVRNRKAGRNRIIANPSILRHFFIQVLCYFDTLLICFHRLNPRSYSLFLTLFR